MKFLSSNKLPLLCALAASAVALPANADGPSLRRGGEAVGAQTRNFSFDNDFGLGIMRFRFNFLAGDNPISRIGHMVGVGASHNWLSTDAFAEYGYDVKHYPVPGVVATTHRLDCEGECALGIPPAPEGELLVLTGFVFEATDGVARDVSTVAIEPDPDDGKIWVEVNDGTGFEYGATVQYSYIPEEDVNGGTLRSMTKTSNEHWRVQHKWPELAGSQSPMLLHGFRVQYTDGEVHPLNRLHIILVTDTATMYFTDAEYDESFTGSIDVVATNY